MAIDSVHGVCSCTRKYKVLLVSMRRRLPRTTRSATLVPCTTRFRSVPPAHAPVECGVLADRVNAILASSREYLAERDREILQREQSEARFRDLANAASDWFWERDTGHALTHTSHPGPLGPDGDYQRLLHDPATAADPARPGHRHPPAPPAPFSRKSAV